jgi:hypothetical protein
VSYRNPLEVGKGIKVIDLAEKSRVDKDPNPDIEKVDIADRPDLERFL